VEFVKETKRDWDALERSFFRKTILELSRQLSAQAIDFDPIEQLLTR